MNQSINQVAESRMMPLLRFAKTGKEKLQKIVDRRWGKEESN